MKHDAANMPPPLGYMLPRMFDSSSSTLRSSGSGDSTASARLRACLVFPRHRERSGVEELLRSIRATLERLEAKLGAPRLAARLLDREQAAAAVGVGVRTFERHIAPELGRVQVGTRVLYPTAEIERWVSARTLRPARRG